ncbi:sigma-70 family RNA polymerase sigma factor [Romeria aff. gracilis LEGE 07310]|uniref:Sigma-70 family RNA polymerase sigma factor n=1 Tax=Vasconcelosia minhoensis LEGE 07310 TaxID=915328 RepID=A0A8J7DR20_9CYAN|nr:sigma-70 family RNA polymerase sigma factor [Romeria gracilis]MBE9077569.1 sigma-70 family RNA polymerase sigma factor [Romeria aff. gracilis LEGE 07310]
MNELQERVQTLIAEACRHPAGSPQRQRRLTQVIRLISGRLWKENTAYYQDALQQTWVYFCRNLCEATTGRAYDPEKANVVTWLNAYLKRRLQDGYIELQKQRATVASSPRASADGQPLDPVDMLPARPDVPPLLENVRAWAESDHQLTCIHLTDHPHITCQLLILKRLPPETPWKVLATELGVPIGTLSSFYQRQCLPLLREFGKSQGYL